MNRFLQLFNTKQNYYNRVGLQIQHSLKAPVTEFEHFISSQTKLPDSFQLWFSSQILHLWMFLHPLQSNQPLTKNTIDLIFHDVEDRLARMDVPQQKLVKQLWEQCLGMCKAYDSSLSTDPNADHKLLDENLLNAVRRNILQNKQYPNIERVTVKYIRGNLAYTLGLKSVDFESAITLPVKISQLNLNK
eukprot:NODE_71_length_24927_cov_1.205937.p17 type:complete len:189 gc:universal NODE_71_length_24927_cov_1.205937:6486-5920(-)